MKCVQCQTSLKTKRENYRYDASGLPVTLVGVEVSRCPKCGDHEVAIPRIETLHRTIALVVARKRGRLAPAETRFLRKHLGLSGADFAKRMGVTPETVSRWENGSQHLGPVADRLVRLMAVHGQSVEQYPLAELAEVTNTDSAPVRLGLKASRDGWSTAHAA